MMIPSTTASVLSLIGAPLPKLPDSPFFWMPTDSSTGAGDTDWLFQVLLIISAVSMALIMGAMIYFVVKYRAKDRTANEVPERASEHNTVLELTWSIIPGIICVALFVWGFKGFVDLHTPPKNSYDIHAQGQKWKWLFTYNNGYTDDVLHVPVGKPVRIIINSVDVIHSLYIPAFRVKQDAVPGRYTELWFQATQTGEFPVECAEYCGTGHSAMLTKVVVHPAGQFEPWLDHANEAANNKPPLELGEELYDKQGCNACHSTDGSKKIGPSWKGIYGEETTLTDGSKVKVDDNYIKESILDPQAKVVSGFGPVMPTFKGKLSDKQIAGLIEYIKSLK